MRGLRFSRGLDLAVGRGEKAVAWEVGGVLTGPAVRGRGGSAGEPRQALIGATVVCPDLPRFPGSTFLFKAWAGKANRPDPAASGGSGRWWNSGAGRWVPALVIYSTACTRTKRRVAVSGAPVRVTVTVSTLLTSGVPATCPAVVSSVQVPRSPEVQMV